MKKRGWIFLLGLFIILGTLVLLNAQTNATTEQEKVNKAYSCLTDKVSGKCSTLSSEEKAFSALATGNCVGDLTSDSKFKADVKYTSQAILAMKGNSDGENWLLSKNATPTTLTWYLQIEASNQTTCSIKYSGLSYNINIDEDKKISSNAGSCLILAQDNYWLRISSSCYDRNFSVSCDQGFLTNLLFKKTTSSTINVLEKTSSAAASGATTEKVESSCFSAGTSCDYEGSLWASLVLDSQGKDVSAYLPYLITMADDNKRFLPEAFLYAITANPEYKISLLSKQKSSQWWMESGDKYYDTALALYPLQTEDSQEKTDAKEWLLTSQDTNGCWEGNTRNTGFILASIWPRQSGGGGTTELQDCEDNGYYCTNSAACDGQILSEFSCPGSLQKCCTTPLAIETCSELGGSICSSNQRCVGGTIVDASDLRNQEICCAQGSCSSVPETTGSECETNNGICRLGGCDNNEEESFYSCEISSDICCVQKTEIPEGKSYWWIWVLIILIVLVVIAIIFRNSLRMFWFRISGGGKTKPGPPSSGSYYPHPGYQRPPQRIIERRILVPHSEPPRRPSRPTGAQKELDEVLKKLKDMGK